MNEIERLKDELRNIDAKKRRAIEHQQYETAAEARTEEKRLTEIIEKLEKRYDIIDSILNG